MDPRLARRFVEGQELAAKRLEPRDAVRDAMALFDALSTLGDVHPAVLALRARDEQVVRERWAKLRAAFTMRG